MTLRLLAGLREIVSSYDGFILDLWGVLHDGSAPFPGVLDALARLKSAGKRLAVLSNAPRRAALVASRMAEIGIPPELYDHVHSSGEEAWQHLKRRDDPFYASLGRRCYHIGPARDDNMLEGIDLERVADIAAAAFILNTGPAGDLRRRAGAALRGAGRARALARQAVPLGLPDLLRAARHRRAPAHPGGGRQPAHRHRRRRGRWHRQRAGDRRHPWRRARRGAGRAAGSHAARRRHRRRRPPSHGGDGALPLVTEGP